VALQAGSLFFSWSRHRLASILSIRETSGALARHSYLSLSFAKTHATRWRFASREDVETFASHEAIP
jgi:hypothetical protein